METKVAEVQLEEDDFEQWIEVEGREDDRVKEIGRKLHNLLLNLTTGEANAVVKRCRGTHGLWHGKGCARPWTREPWHQESSLSVGP